MLGVGGILAEAVADVVFRPAPLDAVTACGDDRRSRDAEVARRVPRGVRRRSRAAGRRPRRTRPPRSRTRDVASVDINPLIVEPSGAVVAVDGLVELGTARRPPCGASPASDRRAVPGAVRAPRRRRLRRIDAPGQVRVRLAAQPARQRLRRRVLRHQPEGRRGARHPDRRRHRRAPRRCDRPRVRVHAGSGESRPAAGMCGQGHPRGVPHVGRLRRGGRRGPTGRGRTRRAGRRTRRSCSPARTVRVWSARRSTCVRRSSRPIRRPGGIGVASQSGNFVSSFLNMSRATGVGISRAISAGNAAAVTVADYLDWYADDDATTVGLAYIEGITDGAGLMDALSEAADAQAARAREGWVRPKAVRRPRRATPGRSPPTTRSSTVRAEPPASHAPQPSSEAFEAAATFATQPLPRGPT